MDSVGLGGASPLEFPAVTGLSPEHNAYLDLENTGASKMYAQTSTYVGKWYALLHMPPPSDSYPLFSQLKCSNREDLIWKGTQLVNFIIMTQLNERLWEGDERWERVHE